MNIKNNAFWLGFLFYPTLLASSDSESESSTEYENSNTCSDINENTLIFVTSRPFCGLKDTKDYAKEILNIYFKEDSSTLDLEGRFNKINKKKKVYLDREQKRAFGAFMFAVESAYLDVKKEDKSSYKEEIFKLIDKFGTEDENTQDTEKYKTANLIVMQDFQRLETALTAKLYTPLDANSRLASINTEKSDFDVFSSNSAGNSNSIGYLGQRLLYYNMMRNSGYMSDYIDPNYSVNYNTPFRKSMIKNKNNALDQEYYSDSALYNRRKQNKVLGKHRDESRKLDTKTKDKSTEPVDIEPIVESMPNQPLNPQLNYLPSVLVGGSSAILLFGMLVGVTKKSNPKKNTRRKTKNTTLKKGQLQAKK